MLLSVLIGFALVAGAASNTCSNSLFTYYPSSDKCMIFFDEMMVYSEALSKCLGQGALVVMPRSPEATSDLQTIIGSSSDVWLGMHDNNMDQVYQYTDNNQVVSGYENFAEPLISRTTTERCASSGFAIGQRRWIIKACEQNLRVVCEAEPLGPPQYICDTKNEWVNMQTDKCFKAYKGHRSFNYDQAKAYCSKRNAFLATSLVTKHHRKQIGKLMGFRGHFWIGFHDQDNNGVYTDTNGVIMSGAAQAFKRKTPRPGRCISFKRKWLFSKSCSRKQRVICQKSADVVA